MELISKYIKGKKYKSSAKYLQTTTYEQDTPVENCTHLFQPLDSSQEYFACKFCGMVVNKNNINQIK